MTTANKTRRNYRVSDATTGRIIGTFSSVSQRGAKIQASKADNTPYAWLSAAEIAPVVEVVSDDFSNFAPNGDTLAVCSTCAHAIAGYGPEDIGLEEWPDATRHSFGEFHYSLYLRNVDFRTIETSDSNLIRHCDICKTPKSPFQWYEIIEAFADTESETEVEVTTESDEAPRDIFESFFGAGYVELREVAEPEPEPEPEEIPVDTIKTFFSPTVYAHPHNISFVDILNLSTVTYIRDLGMYHPNGDGGPGWEVTTPVGEIFVFTDEKEARDWRMTEVRAYAADLKGL